MENSNLNIIIMIETSNNEKWPFKSHFLFLSIQVDFKPQIKLLGKHISEMDASNIKYAFLHIKIT